ncbi:hypothetical protein QP246_02515 [Aerococcus urinae]|uniref:hypothetical protein n=1 Tax=Aerococcus urinae TaxID=1376 RepID=UPI00254E7EFD|nr:hypothetical protein [Aerococcus urinae]MDK6688331.1 hypothetical protein [Aerococcus urinae]
MAIFNTQITPQAKTEQAHAIANNKALVFTKLTANDMTLGELKIEDLGGGQITVSGRYNNSQQDRDVTINNLKLYARVDGRNEFVFAECTSPQGDVSPAKSKQPFIVRYKVTVAVNEQANVGLTYKVDQNHVGTFTQTIGDGTSKDITVNHNLGVRYPLVQVLSAIDPWDVVQVTTIIKDSNSVRFEFAQPPKAGEFAVTIIG